MIQDQVVKQKSEDFASEMKGIFKKYGLSIVDLDKNHKKFKCPDYFVQTRGGKYGFLCECKYIFSAGGLDNGKYNVSTDDFNLAQRNKDAFEFDSFKKVEDVIKGAENQYRELVKNEQKYDKYPFIIALSFDFFADSFGCIPKNIYGLKNVSAILRIERDYEIKQVLEKLTLQQLERLINKKNTIKLPQNTKKFRVLLNKSPNIKFPANKLLKNPLIN